MSWIILAVLLASVVMATGCGDGSAASDSPRDEASSPAVDPSSPIQVAEAFYAAVDEGDVEGAVQWVLPEEQEDCRSDMAQGLPSLPGDYEVAVMAQGDHAEASIVGTQIEVDLMLVDGRWWVFR